LVVGASSYPLKKRTDEAILDHGGVIPDIHKIRASSISQIEVVNKVEHLDL